MSPWRSTSIRAVFARKIRGDELTRRLEIALDIRLQLLGRHLEDVDPGPRKLLEELPARDPRDLRPLALGDPSFAIPLDGRRQSKLAGELLGRRGDARHDGLG